MPRTFKRAFLATVFAVVLALAGAAAYAYANYGTYGFHVVLKRGWSVWVPVTETDPRIKASMRLALSGKAPAPVAGRPVGVEVEPGFESGEMPVFAAGQEVDRILLARFNPRQWRFDVHNDPNGSREPADWLAATKASVVINGAYFEQNGQPSTPMLSEDTLSGPQTYDARHGAFVAHVGNAGVVDLAGKSWRDAFAGARVASVSYPI